MEAPCVNAICVIEFSSSTSSGLVNFVKQCIELPKSPSSPEDTKYKMTSFSKHEKGESEHETSAWQSDSWCGAGLMCTRQLSGPEQESKVFAETIAKDDSAQVYLHVTATNERLLEIADYVDMKKKCVDGTLQVFRNEKRHMFEHHDNLDEFFTVAEKQWLMVHELRSIKVPSNDFVLPGAPKIKLQVGTSLLQQCERYHLVDQIFPLHDETLPALTEKWYSRKSLSHCQPLNDIKEYFGETVGMYFAFLDYYTYALIFPAAVGVMFYLFEFHKTNIQSLIILATFNLIWSTAFMESWKRRSNGLAYVWGTTDIKMIEEARPNFSGKPSKNLVTDKVEPSYPKWKRRMRFYLVSLPIVFICLLLGVVAMAAYLWFEQKTVVWYKSFDKPGYYQEAVSYVPTIVYSVAIIVMNQLYRPLAIQLNEWENHRLQSSFDNHLTIKLVLFWFINTFMLMFYTAFYQQDLVSLRKTVLTELIVTQAVDQLQETVVPYALYKWRKRSAHRQTSTDVVQPLTPRKTINESMKDQYEGTFDDFLELFIQYGYVTLFSCVSPLAAILSLVNNYIELKTDAIKLCKVHQRPFSKPASGIGAWQTVFEIMGYLAIMTNSALIGLCAYQANLLPSTSNLQMLLLIVGLEHLLIIIRVTIAYIIPDAPKWVQIATARDAYQLKTKFLAFQAQSEPLKKTQ